ncbi:MAG: hypothetical protein MK291_13175 [Planctomycetes bacterium]|nr:hypothetical protein [Planctomycetota bacterium]
MSPTPSKTKSAKKPTKKKATKKKKKVAKSKATKKPNAAAKKRGKKAAKTAHENNRNPIRPDEMSADLVEFITAIDSYKRIHERPFPSWSEVLDIVRALGYSRSA